MISGVLGGQAVRYQMFWEGKLYDVRCSGRVSCMISGVLREGKLYDIGCSGRVSCSCSTSGTRGVILFKNPLINERITGI